MGTLKDQIWLNKLLMFGCEQASYLQIFPPHPFFWLNQTQPTGKGPASQDNFADRKVFLDSVNVPEIDHCIIVIVFVKDLKADQVVVQVQFQVSYQVDGIFNALND